MTTADFQLQYTPHDNISLNYTFGLYKRTNQKGWHFHSPAGATLGIPATFVGIILLAANGNDDDNNEQEECYDPYGDCPEEGQENNSTYSTIPAGILVLGILATIIPDELEFHIPITDRFRISPYVNFLGLDFSKAPDGDKVKMRYSWAFGSKLNITSLNENMTYSFFGAYKGISGLGHGPHIGGAIGFILN